MQRRLPEYARIRWAFVEILLGALTFTFLPGVYASDSELVEDPFESAATLAPNIPRQDLLWQSTIKRFASQSLRHPKRAPDGADRSGAKTAKNGGASASSQQSPSPFRKWISPRSSTHKDSAFDEESGAEGVTRTPDRTTGQYTAVTLRLPEDRISSTRREYPERTNGKKSIGEILHPDESHSRGDTDDAVEAGSDAMKEVTTLAEPPQAADEELEEDTETVESPVRVNLPPLSRHEQALRAAVRRVLRHYYLHPFNTRDRSPWEMIHAALSYELYSRVLQGGPDGKPVSAIGWVCFNQPCRNIKLMYVDEKGDFHVRVGPALQGHHGQLLAILAQCDVSSEYPMFIDGHELRIKDLVVQEMKTCYPRSELTFKLIGLMHYLDSDTQWVNDQGMQWNLRKLVAEELRQPLRGAACGGTHRLSGLTLAYKARQRRGEPVDGEYLQARRYIAQHQLYAYRMQNPDGSFSTNWFQGRENENDIDRKLKTTGHILEWLLYSATDRELNSPRTTRAVIFLTNLMYSNRYHDWEAGPLGHALHALVLYDRMKFGPYDTPGDAPVAIRDIVAADKNIRR